MDQYGLHACSYSWFYRCHIHFSSYPSSVHTSLERATCDRDLNTLHKSTIWLNIRHAKVCSSLEVSHFQNILSSEISISYRSIIRLKHIPRVQRQIWPPNLYSSDARPAAGIYVINSVSLIPPLQHELRTIAFAPIETQAVATVMGVGPAGNAIIGSDKTFEHDSYLSTFVPSTVPASSPDPGLDAINGAAIHYMSNSLRKLNQGGSTTVKLFSWIRRQLFMATTASIYGPKNPFRGPLIENAW